MYSVTIGQDVSCYATIHIPESTPLNREVLTEIVNDVIFNGEWEGKDVIFEVEWDTSNSTRIVSVIDENGDYLVEDMPIDPSSHDAGLALQNWLNGLGTTFQAVINEAARARLIDDPVMETHRGTFQMPGNEPVEVVFKVRKGATHEEKAIAFLDALAQVAKIQL